MADLDEAVRIAPANVQLRNNRGTLRFLQGQYDPAIEDFTEALRLDPKDAMALSGRGYCYYFKLDTTTALKDLNDALQINPGYAGALNNLAWILATCTTDSVRDGKKAVETAQKACEATAWKEPHCIGTLAAAYAESGDFDQAVKYQRQAMSFGKMTDKERTEMQRRLALFMKHQPDHEPPMM